MIALIVCIFLTILAVLLLILYSKTLDEVLLSIGVPLFFVVGLVLFTSLGVGTSIHRQNTTKYIAEKEQIEYMLENKPSIYVIDQAKRFNNNIQCGNNYWCRFTIEDRSEYMIDIDSYVNKKHK